MMPPASAPQTDYKLLIRNPKPLPEYGSIPAEASVAARKGLYVKELQQ